MPDLEPALGGGARLRNDKKKSKRRNHKSRSGAAETKRKQREEGKKLRGVSDSAYPRPVLCLAGPDPDLSKRRTPHLSSSFPSSPLNPHFNPHSSEPSFSQAFKQCQKQSVRSEPFVQLSMSKSSAESSRSRSGTFPSPGTPNHTRYGLKSTAIQKGWSSERVPLSQTNNRGYIQSGIVLPFNHGQKLPSKWEDAEKWILSPPVSGARLTPGPPAHHRRPKSKSGPLGGHTDGYTASSPAPFLARVLIPEHGGVSFGNDDNDGGNNGILRSVSVNGWMDTLMEATAALPPSRQIKPEEKVQITREAVERITASILTKDVATQMSSEESATSSPKELSFSYSGPIEEANNNEGCSAKMEVRDVEIDKQVTVTRWSKKNVLRSFDKRSVDSKARSSANWEERERARGANKSKKEEAKITAWENLQKAKAEAEIRKLEMKLERKRESSMERILSRLRRAQKKAEGMRHSVSSDQDQCVRKSVGKPPPFRCTGKHISLTGCFPCVVFK